MGQIKQYRKKPVVIDAAQWSGGLFSDRKFILPLEMLA